MSGTSDWTPERPAPGVVVHQPRRGFRYSADAFWLAGFALEPDVPATAVDLGTGSGIVAFLLAAAGVQTRGVDAFDGWAEGWRRSLRDSDAAPTLERVDVRDVGGRAALVTCNPPFFTADSGPVSPDPFKAVARTEADATLADFVRAAARIATERAVFVVPVDRETEVLAHTAHLQPSRRLRIGRKRVLLELRPDGVLTEDAALERDDPRVVAWTRLG
ncbi:MAG: hypothetical protein H6737_25305 [Alphaproteobacteria bacterium]|nr:hypothetical protein [Alphaproteobacteria bacterium]